LREEACTFTVAAARPDSLIGKRWTRGRRNGGVSFGSTGGKIFDVHLRLRPCRRQAAPDFTLPASNGQTIRFSDFKGKKTVRVVLLPKGRYPRLHEEACGFRDALADYDKANVAVLGSVRTRSRQWTSFREVWIELSVLADADHAVTERYGQWVEKSMYGKKYWGAARTTFVIGKDGRILHVFEKVKPEGHDQEVLAVVKENGGGTRS